MPPGRPAPRDLAPFVTAQNEYSLYNRTAEVELTPACLELGVGILPYFPLAYGLLTGKYRRGEDAPAGSRLSLASQARRLANADWDRIESLQAFADLPGDLVARARVGGLAAQPAVASVIAGVTRPEQVEANVRGGGLGAVGRVARRAGAARPAGRSRTRRTRRVTPEGVCVGPGSASRREAARSG